MGSPGSQKSKADLTREALDRLLHWLDRDRDRAGQRYEQIRSGLIEVFLCRGAVDQEELADETINRVAGKVQEIADNYVGDPTLYFYGVAKMVYLEYSRRKLVAPHPPPNKELADQMGITADQDRQSRGDHFASCATHE